MLKLLEMEIEMVLNRSDGDPSPAPFIKIWRRGFMGFPGDLGCGDDSKLPPLIKFP